MPRLTIPVAAAWVSFDSLFASLDPTRVALMIAHAETHTPPTAPKRWSVCHPVCRLIWLRDGAHPSGLDPNTEWREATAQGEFVKTSFKPHRAPTVAERPGPISGDGPLPIHPRYRNLK